MEKNIGADVSANDPSRPAATVSGVSGCPVVSGDFHGAGYCNGFLWGYTVAMDAGCGFFGILYRQSNETKSGVIWDYRNIDNLWYFQKSSAGSEPDTFRTVDGRVYIFNLRGNNCALENAAVSGCLWNLLAPY